MTIEICLVNDDVRTQGVDDFMEANKEVDRKHLSEIENLEDDDIDDNANVNELNILDQSDGSNLQDKIDGNYVDDMD
jgi:hypothetical protein